MNNDEILNLKAESQTSYFLALKLKQSHKYKDCIEHLIVAIEKRKQALTTSNDQEMIYDEQYAQLVTDLGDAYLHTNNTDKALENFNQAITILEKLFYPGHTKIAPVLNYLVDIHLANNDYEKACPQLIRLLEIYEKTMSGEHRLVLENAFKLAKVYFHLNKLDDCKKVMTKAMKQLDTPLGPIEEFQLLSAQVAIAENNLAEATKLILLAINNFEQRNIYSKLAICYDLYVQILVQQDKNADVQNIQEKAMHCHNLAKKVITPDPFSATLLRA